MQQRCMVQATVAPVLIRFAADVMPTRRWSDLSEQTRRLLITAAVARCSPASGGAHRHQAPTGKPDPRQETSVCRNRRAHQLRRNPAHLVLRLREVSAALIRLLAGEAEGQRSPNTEGSC